MGEFLLIVFLIWLIWQFIKPASKDTQNDKNLTEINAGENQLAPLDDWKNKLTPKYEKFLKQYGSPQGETLTEFLRRFDGQRFLDSSEEEQENQLLQKHKTSSPTTKDSTTPVKTEKLKKEPSRTQSKKIVQITSNTKSNGTKSSKQKKRICRKCGVEYPLTKDYFGHAKKTFRWTCRKCQNKYSSEYGAANPESVRRRSKKRQASSGNWKATDSMKKTLNKEQKGICGLCGNEMEKDFLNNQLCQVDHLTPVAQGGSNDLSNLVLAHRTCNQEKANKTLREYFQWRERVGEPKSKYTSPKIVKALSLKR